MVVTGDITQIDLPPESVPPVDARQVLKNLKDIGIVHLGKQDVVRNPLVQKIVHAYENAGRPEGASPEEYGNGGNSGPPESDGTRPES